MSVEAVKAYFASLGLEGRVVEHASASDTVEHAAEVCGCRPEEIVKTLSFLVDGRALLICAAGDAKVNGSRFKAQFGEKAVMIPRERVEELTGHAPGGVCPFACREGTLVCLDVSIQRFGRVHAAAGSPSSTIALTPEELFQWSHAAGWVDVCKGWREDAPD